MRDIPAPLYGVTVDNASGAGTRKINAHKTALSALPHMPTVRCVFDENVNPSEYARWVNGISPVAYVMGELLDSTALKSSSLTAYKARTTAYLKAFPSLDIWECGNELGGNWVGPYADQAAKASAAVDLVKAAGGRAAITLWENSWGPDHCGDGTAEPTPQQFSTRFSSTTRAKVDYLFLSWYPTQCTTVPDVLVPAPTIKAEVQALHVLWPNARIGFGELGLPRRVSSTTLARAQSIATYYYQLGNLGLSYYVGGYFWWYAAEDAIPLSKPMGQTLIAAMQ